MSRTDRRWADLLTTHRIVFVDDEPNVLAGLRRMLRFKREVWDMQFVESGQQALALMAEHVGLENSGSTVDLHVCRAPRTAVGQAW
jgi:CheY-like chemotaxis protein